MNTASFFFRLRHQFLWQSRWLVLPLILFVVVLSARYFARSPRGFHSADPVGLSSWTGMAFLAALAAWMVFAAIRWQAPANTNTATHTRPLGGGVIFASHLLTFALWIVIPWLMVDVLTLQNYGFTWRSWSGVIVSSVLVSGSFAMLLAALCSLAASRAQFVILTFICVTTAATWYFLNKHSLTSRTTNSFTLANLRPHLATVLPSLFLLVASVLSCFFSVVKRGRTAALIILIIGLAQWPLTQRWWLTDSPPGLQYPKTSSHQLLFSDVPAESDKAHFLWPNLHLAGLASDEVASVVAFAPIVKGAKWPGSHISSDYRDDEDTPNIYPTVITNDHLRKIASFSPLGELWRAGVSGKRPTLQALLDAAKDDQSSWRLRLAIHGMRRAISMPSQELLQNSKDLIIREGERVEIGPLRTTERGKFPAAFTVARVPLFSTDPKPAMRGLGGRFWLPDCVFIFRHTASRENVVAQMSSSGVGANISENPWLVRSSLSSDLLPPLPYARLEFLGISETEWLQATTLEIWCPQERGVMEFEISIEQMRKLVSEAK